MQVAHCILHDIHNIWYTKYLLHSQNKVFPVVEKAYMAKYIILSGQTNGTATLQ